MKSEAKKKVAVFLVAALIATTVPFNFTSVKAQAKTNQNNKYSVRVNAEEEPVTVDGQKISIHLLSLQINYLIYIPTLTQ